MRTKNKKTNSVGWTFFIHLIFSLFFVACTPEKKPVKEVESRYLIGCFDDEASKTLFYLFGDEVWRTNLVQHLEQQWKKEHFKTLYLYGDEALYNYSHIERFLKKYNVQPVPVIMYPSMGDRIDHFFAFENCLDDSAPEFIDEDDTKKYKQTLRIDLNVKNSACCILNRKVFLKKELKKQMKAIITNRVIDKIEIRHGWASELFFSSKQPLIREITELCRKQKISLKYVIPAKYRTDEIRAFSRFFNKQKVSKKLPKKCVVPPTIKHKEFFQKGFEVASKMDDRGLYNGVLPPQLPDEELADWFAGYCGYFEERNDFMIDKDIFYKKIKGTRLPSFESATAKVLYEYGWKAGYESALWRMNLKPRHLDFNFFTYTKFFDQGHKDGFDFGYLEFIKEYIKDLKKEGKLEEEWPYLRTYNPLF